jgi:hypothetical protein
MIENGGDDAAIVVGETQCCDVLRGRGCRHARTQGNRCHEQ